MEVRRVARADERGALGRIARAVGLCAAGVVAIAATGLDPAPAPQAQPRSDDPVLVALASSDPLALASAVDRAGDDAVLERLGDADAASDALDPAVVGVAISAAPWLAEPERAFRRLIAIARGHDPDLAPAAMLALLGGVERIDRAGLDAREAELEPIREALPLLDELAADASVRLDIRRAAARARELLRGVLEP